MEMVDLILAKTGLSVVILRLKNTVDELKEKTPGKVELIESCENSLNTLIHAQNVIHRMDLELTSYRQRNLSLEINHLNQLQEIKEHKDKINELMKML